MPPLDTHLGQVSLLTVNAADACTSQRNRGLHPPSPNAENEVSPSHVLWERPVTTVFESPGTIVWNIYCGNSPQTGAGGRLPTSDEREHPPRIMHFNDLKNTLKLAFRKTSLGDEP